MQPRPGLPVAVIGRNGETMAEFATARAATGGALSAKAYWKITGPVLALVALLGIGLALAGVPRLLPGFLEFDAVHNVLHVALAALALTLGYGAASAALAKTAAKVVGVVYLALGVVGFFLANVFGLLHLEIGENLIHLALGAWGVAAGFARG